MKRWHLWIGFTGGSVIWAIGKVYWGWATPKEATDALMNATYWTGVALAGHWWINCNRTAR